MLDLRVYRAAFVPALVALFVVAFSLTDPAKPRTTRLAPLAFDDARAFATLEDLAEAFPRRRPGSTDDAGLADRVAAAFERTGFARTSGVQRRSFEAATLDGDVTLETVVAAREGLSNHTLVVVAHRDAADAPARAELSGTAALLELARLFADRDLAKTVVLASVSGGSGGFAGAREAVAAAPGPVDGVVVLGDLASRAERRPFVVGWRTGPGPVPQALERTAQAALRSELDADPGHARTLVQLLRRALPLTLSEQGPAHPPGGAGAILISASSERTPRADAAVSRAQLRSFGRGVLRTLYASLDASGDDPFPESDGIVVAKRLIPTWSIRLLVLALLAPALLTAFDGFFRARRRGEPMGAWALWAAGFVLPVLLAWGFARLLAVVGAVDVLGAPEAVRASEVAAAAWACVAASLLLLVAGAIWLGPALTRRRETKGAAATRGGAAAATGLMLTTLVLLVWLVNPYAAAVLLPAAHFWLLAGASDRRPGRTAGVAVVVGVVAPVLLVLFYLLVWGLSPLGAVWTAFGLVAGGVLGPGAAVTVAVYLGALAATVAILRIRRAHADTEPGSADRLVTRGPRSYAGPGSLGGTESALRR